MSSPLLLRAFVNERLTAAAEEIFGVFERTIAKYEEEVSYSQQEIERLRRLLLDYSQKTDPLQLVCKEETPTEQHHCVQAWSPSVGQRNPEIIKEEEQELWTSEQEQQVQEFKDANILYVPPSSTWVKNEQDSSLSLQPQIQNNENGEHLEELQETKIIQFALPLVGTWVENEQDPTPSSQAEIHNNESVQGDGESERPVQDLNTLKLKERQTGKSPRSLFTSMETIEVPPTPGHCCYLCEKPFASKQHLINHVQRIHSKEAGILCGVCGKKLESTDSLTVHLNTHKGSRFCHVCGKHCNSKTSLTEHMASHAGVKLHRCHVCGKECSRKGDMKIHMRIHTGEKPFCCSFCRKSFTHSGHLRKHMRSHTGERPHQCEVCGRGFLQSTHLKCHLRTHAQKY